MKPHANRTLGFFAPRGGAGPKLLPPTETQRLIAESRELRQRSCELRGEMAAALESVQTSLLETQALAAKAVSAVPDLLGRLTRREREVLMFVAAGYSSKRVAAVMGITFKTAVCHRSHVMEKLNIHDTAGLTRIAVRSGLIRA